VKRKTHKVCKKHVNLPKTGGNLKSRGERIILSGEEIRNLWLMTKKSHKKFWLMKTEQIFGKR